MDIITNPQEDYRKEFKMRQYFIYKSFDTHWNLFDLKLQNAFCLPFCSLTLLHSTIHISLPRDSRKYVVSRIREGCAPLFVVCKRGNLEIAEFLISECTADIEQRGLFENPEDSTVHHVTPLWCAAVLSKLPIVRYLVHTGADINAVSDSGSTSVRSSCFMTNMVRNKFINNK